MTLVRLTTVEKWISAIGLAAIVAAAYFLGTLNNRVAQLEQQSKDLSMGPRGQSCQLIVAKLVDRPTDQALQGLAEKWGCAAMPATQILDGYKRCPSGAIVPESEKCGSIPPPPPQQ